MRGASLIASGRVPSMNSSLFIIHPLNVAACASTGIEKRLSILSCVGGGDGGMALGADTVIMNSLGTYSLRFLETVLIDQH